MSTVRIRVLIADAFPIVLQGLRNVLSHNDGILIFGEATNGVDTIEKAVHLDPDVVVMDLKLPKVNGLTVVRDIRIHAPRSKVMLFASSESRNDFFEAMKLGCSGILLKESSTSLLEESIYKVHAGEIWIDSNPATAVIRHFTSPDLPAAASKWEGTKRFLQLSRREREVVIPLVQGLSNKEIAQRLSITEQTVKNHLHSVFSKLGVSDRLELALFAIYTNFQHNPNLDMSQK